MSLRIEPGASRSQLGLSPLSAGSARVSCPFCSGTELVMVAQLL